MILKRIWFMSAPATADHGRKNFEIRRGKTICSCASDPRRDADTGELKWYYQLVPGDSWDFDSVQQLIFADLRINDQNRKVIMQANKDGFFYVLDRTNGKVDLRGTLRASQLGHRHRSENGPAQHPPEALYGKDQTITIMPGPGGGHNWAPMSFNPTLNSMYIPTSASSSSQYAVAQNFDYNPKRAIPDLLVVVRAEVAPVVAGGAPPLPPANGIAPIQDPGAAIGAGQAAPPPPTCRQVQLFPWLGRSRPVVGWSHGT